VFGVYQYFIAHGDMSVIDPRKGFMPGGAATHPDESI